MVDVSSAAVESSMEATSGVAPSARSSGDCESERMTLWMVAPGSEARSLVSWRATRPLPPKMSVVDIGVVVRVVRVGFISWWLPSGGWVG